MAEMGVAGVEAGDVRAITTNIIEEYERALLATK